MLADAVPEPSPSFTTQVRHEMRTQLNHVLGYVDLLLDDLTDADPSPSRAAAGRALDDIAAAAQRAEAAVTEFLQPSALDRPTALAALRRAFETVLARIAELVGQAAVWTREDAVIDLLRIQSAAAHGLALASHPLVVGGLAAGTSLGAGEAAPAGPDASPAAPPVAPRPGRWAVHGTVLVVDDDPANRDVLARRLERLGHQVRLAADGREALDMLRTEPPDLMLLDLIMPEMNGYEVLEACREDDRLRELPVIMISARDDVDDVVECIGLGAEDFLPKPFDPVLLEARVNASLEKKWLRDQERALLATVQRQAATLAELNAGLEARVRDQVAEIERLAQLRRFLSPQVADLILNSGDQRILQSHRSDISVLFCDLRGFTAFAETAEPEEIMAVLGEFHQAVGELIHQFQATVGYFAGDGLMVCFNDPIPCPDPAERAVRLAVAMRNRMNGLVGEWVRRGYEIGFGSGVTFGYATLGQIGFEGRYDYGVIGSVVNLAARLCGHARSGQILISRRTYLAVEHVVDVEDLGTLALKGFHAPVPAYNVTAIKA